MVAEKGKKAKLAEEEIEQPADHIDGELVLSVEKLQELQDDLEKINEEACEKVLEVEQKYNEKRRPAYIKRNEIIKSIPDFWLTIFLSHPVLGDLLTEEDQKIFKHLNSLDVEDFKDVKSGYAITFFFNENPYFEDSKLEKTFTFFDEGSTEITGTSIKWKDGKETANGDNNEKKGNKRLFVETSFFSWFAETEQKDGAELHDEIAEIIKEDLWPNPLKYFQNDADEEDSDGDEDEDEDEDDQEEEEEENGDEQDDEDIVEDGSEEDK